MKLFFIRRSNSQHLKVVIPRVSRQSDIMQNQNKKNIWIVLFLIISSWSINSQAIEFDNERPTVLITGSNRNIGLEFVKQFSNKNWNVIATTRRPEDSKDLNDFAKNNKNIAVELLDVTNNEDISNLSKKYENQTIDILLNNAALTPRYMSAFKRINGVDEEKARESFEVNALGTMKVIQGFMNNVELSEKGKIIALSSKAGSFDERPKIPMMYGYAMSKAALNSMIYSLSFETKKKNIIAVVLSPGTVNTTPGMSLMGAIDVDESVSKMMAVIDELTMEHNGLFLDYEDGRTIDW